MKKISKIKLNNLSKLNDVALHEKEMQHLKGGQCGWKCFWDFDESKAVRRNWDPGYC